MLFRQLVLPFTFDEVLCRVDEYVIDWGPAYRIYLAKDGDTLIVLFGGGTKRGQQRDIDKAKALLAEYKARKKVLVSIAPRKNPR